jgi:hypothetical protein
MAVSLAGESDSATILRVGSVARPVRIETGSTPWIVERSSPESSWLTLKYQIVLGRDIKSRLDRVEITESESSVQLEVIQTIRTGSAANKWVSMSDLVEVELAAPLGSRGLFHAPVTPVFEDLVPTATPPEHEV